MVREMKRADVQRVRSFNRLVAERIGALSDEFLGRGRPMGESRTLWEIGPGGAEVRELRVRLGLDSGYASRVLRSLSRQGLIRIAASTSVRRAAPSGPTSIGAPTRWLGAASSLSRPSCASSWWPPWPKSSASSARRW
jgi:hypothetical protein